MDSFHFLIFWKYSVRPFKWGITWAGLCINHFWAIKCVNFLENLKMMRLQSDECFPCRDFCCCKFPRFPCAVVTLFNLWFCDLDRGQGYRYKPLKKSLEICCQSPISRLFVTWSYHVRYQWKAHSFLFTTTPDVNNHLFEGSATLLWMRVGLKQNLPNLPLSVLNRTTNPLSVTSSSLSVTTSSLSVTRNKQDILAI